MVRILVSLFFFVVSFNVFSQDVVPERTTEFSVKVSHLKTQAQLDIVKQKVAQMPNVKNVRLSWDDYILVFEVKEGGDYGFFQPADLKQVLISEGVEIDKIDRKTLTK